MGYRTWNFDIDRFLNPLVPPPPWKHFPYPVARMFGYRRGKLEPVGNLMPTFWAFIGIFCAIIIIEVVSKHVPAFQHQQVPMIVGSFGAAAVLEFYAIDAPLAQPRNAVFGQLISSIVGVAIAKLFQLSDRFTDIQYLGGALACACATSLMALTKTVHPPAGATALLAVVDDRLVHIGWWLIPVMMLGICLMICVALIVNNIERRFPVYWWTPNDLRKGKSIFKVRKDVENQTQPDEPAEKKLTVDGAKVNGHGISEADAISGAKDSKDSSQTDGKAPEHKEHDQNEIIIRSDSITVPEGLYLTQENRLFLEILSKRL